MGEGTPARTRRWVRRDPSARLRQALVLSGAGSLLHQMVWNRSWVLIFGSGVATTATVLAVYMLGLGLGGQLVDRLARLLGARGARLYRRLELGAALLSAACPFLLGAVDGWHLELARSHGLDWAGLHVWRLVFALLVLLPPVILVGATLPAAAQEAAGAEDPERVLGRLYAWNTLGGVLGVLLGAHLAIPRLGLRASTFLASALGLAAVAWARGLGEEPAAPPEAEPLEVRRAGPVFVLYALVGFWGMALEVFYSRAVLTAAGSSVHAYAAVLGAFLGGMALGSTLGSVFRGDPEDPLASLARRLVLLGAVVAATSLVLPHYNWIYLRVFPWHWELNAAGAEVATWVLALSLLLPVGVGLGAIFPVAARCLLVLGDPGRAVGWAFFVNSVGGAAGALAAYHWIAPGTGLVGGVQAAALSLVLAGGWTLCRGGVGRSPGGVREGCAVIVVAAVLFLARPTAPRFLLRKTAYRTAESARNVDLEKLALSYESITYDPVVWYEDGPDASVAVTMRNRDPKQLALRINGKTDGTVHWDRETQTALGLLPALLRPPGDEALMVGLGVGGSAHALLAHPIRSLHIAELSPTVLRAARAAFRPHFPRAFDDPRASIHVVDGRLMVRAWPRKVGILASEPTNLFVEGVGNLFTVEFLRSCRERLLPGGVLVLWIQSYNLSGEALAMLTRTLRAVFPHLVLNWYFDFFFVASEEPVAFDYGVIRERLLDPGFQAVFRQASLPPSAGLLARRILAHGEALRTWAGRGPLVTDDLPAIEFLAARDRFRDTGDELVETLRALREQPAYSDPLPFVNLLVPGPDGGARFEMGGLRLGPGMGGEAGLYRIGSQGEVTTRSLAGTDLVEAVEWSREDGRGLLRVKGYPRGTLRSPKLPLQALIAYAQGVGGEVGEVRVGRMHDHPALWLVFRGTASHPGRALMAWACPSQGKTYTLEARDRAGDHYGLLADAVPQISCLHGSPGRETWKAGGLVRPARGELELPPVGIFEP